MTPYVPQVGWTYYIEAVREQTWPSCAYRFLSYSNSCDQVDLWNAAGINQEFTLLNAGNGNFYLKTSCGKYLSYPGDCNSHILDLWSEAGINQQFKLVTGDNTQFEYYLEAVGRGNCDYKWASFPVGCTTSSPDKIDLWYATGPDQRFRIHPVRSSSPMNFPSNSDTACADPYAWYSTSSDSYMLQCTFDMLSLSSSNTISPTSYFKRIGNTLGGTPASWAKNYDKWAPENAEVGNENYVFFAASQPDGIHRIGWALSTNGTKDGSWNQYSSTYLNLGNTAGGEIDGTVFKDVDGTTYLVWKSDDNNAGDKVTRIWAQVISLGGGSVRQLSSPQVIMDSTGLWWVDSWVQGGSLVEGPEIVHLNGYYYLFFASGKYCQSSYAEGVARSTSIWGPYEKMGVPLLSTGMVGYNNGQKLIGPGHASFLFDKSSNLFAVWHASVASGNNCVRYPYISNIRFGNDKWPYADL